MIKKEDLITIVVPIYKVEQYLNRCIDSIINQTYKNLEIILVDDGSPDNCGKICDEYKKKDERIKVVHKENGGLSDARNCGIDLAKGKYITFIDSDDYVSKDFIEYLYNLIKKTKSDISICSFLPFFGEIENKNNEEIIKVLETKDALQRLFYQNEITTSAWAKIYKKEFFEKIKFPKGEICEDLDTTYKVFAKANKITISNQKKYYYLQRPDSIINSNFSLKRMKAIEFAEKSLQYIKKMYPELELAVRNRLFMEAVFISIQIPKNNYRKEQKKLYEIIKENRKLVLRDKISKKGYRFIAFLSYFGITPIKILFILKNKLGG